MDKHNALEKSCQGLSQGKSVLPIKSQFYGDSVSIWLMEMKNTLYIWIFKKSFDKIP